MDEKSAIQALDRLDPVLPLSPRRAERHGFEYFRHGTLSLYAALETRSGQVIGSTASRHTSQEFVRFLQEVVATQPCGKEIHLIVDNLSAPKTKLVFSAIQVGGERCDSVRKAPRCHHFGSCIQLSSLSMIRCGESGYCSCLRSSEAKLLGPQLCGIIG